MDIKFNDAIICKNRHLNYTDLVVFGDSIFAGCMPAQDQYIIGNGVMQQFATLARLPLQNYAIPGATLSQIQTDPKCVVQQISEWKPRVDSTPLILLDGGTNDQYIGQLKNLDEYGSNDSKTIYGAINNILAHLIHTLNLQPWQIVVVTPIPKSITGDKQFRNDIDNKLLQVGYAMYQVGLAHGVSIINGYNTIFNSIDNIYAKRLLLPDDTHPSEEGAKYFAHYLYNQLI